MKEKEISEAALHFGAGTPQIETLGAGLIHRTYKVTFGGVNGQMPLVLQNVNRHTFPEPEKIVRNYQLIASYLEGNSRASIPPIVATHEGKYYWEDEQGNFWRATGFISHSFAPVSPRSAGDAQAAALRFAAFTHALKDIDIRLFEIIIPGFHNLAERYRQFESAIARTDEERRCTSENLIDELKKRIRLVDFYRSIEGNPDYPLRVMHHDCKISNMLFDTRTGEPICPVDLDTVMPGLFFSDVGDMVRSMAGSEDENSTDFNGIRILPEYYQAIISGYLEGMGGAFTQAEKDHIHHGGLIIIYMQALRFMSDYLNGDVYYKTSYPNQNFDRTKNQLTLLQKLERFLEKEYQYQA